MSVKLGTRNVDAMKFGSRDVAGLYLGGSKVEGVGVALPSLKRSISQSSDIFYVNQYQASGKGLAVKVMRGDGANDAGTAHQTFRFGPVFQIDALNDNPSAINFKGLATSNGAKDYALKSEASTHGGSYHGGQTLKALGSWHGANAGQTSPVFLADDATWDPTQTTNARKFQILQSSDIAWGGTPGQTASVDERLTFEEDNVVLLEARLESTLVNAINTLSFPTLDFADPRYTRLVYEGGSVDMAGNNTEYTIPAGVLKVRMLDPRTGDYADIEVTSDKAFGRVYVLFNTSYSKLYFGAPTNVAMGVWNITKKTTFYIAPKVVPATPYTDLFDGAALSSYWFLAQSAGAPNSVVTGGEWVLTATADNNRFTHPICDAKSPGTYHIELDYKTDAASTAAVAYILRHDSGSQTNSLQGGFNLNSTGGTTLSIDVVVAAGESPVLMIQPGATGRVLRLREMRITRTA